MGSAMADAQYEVHPKAACNIYQYRETNLLPKVRLTTITGRTQLLLTSRSVSPRGSSNSTNTHRHEYATHRTFDNQLHEVELQKTRLIHLSRNGNRTAEEQLDQERSESRFRRRKWHVERMQLTLPSG